MEIRLKTLTPIWTGGVDQKWDSLHDTGIVGSLRWWCEALVRGMGGYACDPSKNKCEYKKDIGQKSICVTCNLFGCTGWSRKFRFIIIDNNGNPLTFKLEKGMVFSMRFVELRPLSSEEKWLLHKTIWLISKYGSIGGKTTFKPSEGQEKQKKLHHQDFGLISLESRLPKFTKYQKEKVQEYFKCFKQDLKPPPEWPNLNFFFFSKGKYLSRPQINDLMKQVAFLKGKIGESKKVFSFQKEGGKIWGYVKDKNMLLSVIEKLNKLGITEIIKGYELIQNEI